MKLEPIPIPEGLSEDEKQKLYFKNKEMNKLLKQMRSTNGIKPRVLMLMHTTEVPNSCKHCKKAFSQRHYLETHLLIHSKRPLTCPQCDKTCEDMNALKVHIALHTRDKPFDCMACGKGYFQKKDLGFHLRVHAHGKKYACGSCDKGFTEEEFITHANTYQRESMYMTLIW